MTLIGRVITIERKNEDKKQKTDAKTKQRMNNREKYNIAIAILEKWTT